MHNNARNAKIGIFVLFLQSATRNVMNLGFRKIFIMLLTLFSAIIVPAQELPLMQADPAVLKGVMPNGMAYYLVENPTLKGVADFALVQKTGNLTADDSTGRKAVDASRTALSSLKLISPSSPYDYIVRHKIAPGKEGFVKVTDDATVFRLSDVKLSGSDVLDSTLLIIMGIADRANRIEDEFINKWYSPADQAVIVSGDIDSKSVASKLCNMSYMIPSRKTVARREYSGKAEETVHTGKTGDDGFVEVSASWTSKRVPREYMNTVQPEIFEMSLNTLGTAAVARIKRVLRNMDVPAADVSYGHVCSSSYPYDDSFTIRAVVDSADASKAFEAIAGVMSSIDAEGIGTNEYVLAESAYIRRLAEESGMPLKPNGEIVDRCKNAFLYNSSLASPKERFDFHTSGNLPDTMRQRFFNNVAKAFIDDSLLKNGMPVPPVSVNMSDTLNFPSAGAKVRLRSSKKEHVSGGTIWTFSNGFKVVYKRMDTDRMYYNLALNGGYASMERLSEGEGAFLADYIRNCHVNGLKAEDFLNILNVEGITMDFAVSMSNMMVSGSLPKERMRLLMRSLLALANGMTPDQTVFDYYKKCEYAALDWMKGSFEARMADIDNIMCPDYRYSPYKQKGNITEDFIKKAEGFYNDRFSRMNDGALILVGNMEEDKLKKILTEYVGDFRTSDVAFRRPVVRYQPVSGWSTYTVDGDIDNIDVAISARMPLTMENFIASDLAATVLKRELAKELDQAGMYFTLTYNCKINPEERFNLLISVSEASEEGFPAGMKPKTPIEVLSYVRSALSGLHKIEITAEDLKPYKEALKSSMTQEMKSPEYWVHAIALRYLDGKDFSTNYVSKIDAVTPDKVMSILSLLDSGSKVEYVIIR